MVRRAIVVASLTGVDRLPGKRKALVERQLLPHFEPFFAAEGATFDQAVNPPVSKAILISRVVEARVASGLVTIFRL